MKLSLGRIVLVKNGQIHNGNDTHPAIINRVWGTGDTTEGPQCANVTVLPDCAMPYSVTSVRVFDTEEKARESGDGQTAWWPPKV